MIALIKNQIRISQYLSQWIWHNSDEANLIESCVHYQPVLGYEMSRPSVDKAAMIAYFLHEGLLCGDLSVKTEC